MGVVAASLQGRFGNQMFTYAYARGYAERYGAEFQCEPWIGSKIFLIDDKPVTDSDLPRRDENTITPGEADICIRTYAQNQQCVTYTRDHVKSWFVLRPEIETMLRECIERASLVAHRRAGDYFGYGYPVVSTAAYLNACERFGLPASQLQFVTEETALELEPFQQWAPFLPDFYRLMTADVLLRGNSTFSWWAATLGNHSRVFSPVIDGLEGGREHDCEFREGNSARFCNLHFVTDLHL
jgi:hypothetical protein